MDKLILLPLICCLIMAGIYTYYSFKYYNYCGDMQATKIYISGPITGVESAKLIFMNVDKFIRYNTNFITVNPFNNGLPDSASYEEHMKADLKMLERCDCIALMPGWQESEGCKRELLRAIELGMRVFVIHSPSLKDGYILQGPVSYSWLIDVPES